MGDFDEKSDENANKNAKHWECKFCEKKYKYQSSLCKHVTKKHKPFFDEVLTKNANKMLTSNLEKKKSKHWECKYCDKIFKYQSSLCKHVTKKHKNSKQTVMIFCEDCEKVKEVKIIQIILK